MNDKLTQLLETGKSYRANAPRHGHAMWKAPVHRPEPIALLEESSVGRLADLIPVRYWRMMESPFTFLRGAPIVMSSDLGRFTPSTGLRVQACGDCHIQNFGIFATPERNLIFDINDFDETLSAPWEWDLKRLTVSIHVAGRVNGASEEHCAEAVYAAATGYASQMQSCTRMTALEIWYARIDAADVLAQIKDANLRRLSGKNGNNAPSNTHELVAEDYTHGGQRIIDKPPKLFHPPPDGEVIEDAASVLKCYRASLRDDIALLFERYQLADLAMKVVGIGSVGTRCAVALLLSQNDDALILQIKEARRSVLELYAEASPYASHGQRVVAGQRLLQVASDIFLGWTQSDDGHHFYIRQVSDRKGTADVRTMNRTEFLAYAKLCGTVLALAHARSGEPAVLAGYIGNSGRFEQAIVTFAAAYADQNERDYEMFTAAIRNGRLPTREG